MNFGNPYLARTSVVRLVLSVAAIGVSVASALHLALVYPTLPAIVPTHFDLAGKVDGHGPKESLWLVAGISLVVTMVITGLQFIDPKRANYSIRITDKSRAVAYTVMPVFICSCGLVVGVISAITEAMSLNGGAGGAIAFLIWIPIGALALASVIYIGFLWWLEHRG